MASNPRGGGQQGRGPRGQTPPPSKDTPPRPQSTPPSPRPGAPPPRNPPPPPPTPSKHLKNPQTQKDQSTSLFASIFGQAMFANKWQRAMSEDRQAKIVELFTIPRNDPYDVYKVNSQTAVGILAELPASKPLSPDRIQMLHEIALNYDYGIQLDIIEAYRPTAFISQESRDQLARLPSWLRFLVIFRYDLIHAKFQHHTHHFIKMLANYIETRRTTTGTGVDTKVGLENEDDDHVDNEEIFNKYLLTEPDIIPPKRPTWERQLIEGNSGVKVPGLPGGMNSAGPRTSKGNKLSTPQDKLLGQIRDKSDLAKVKNAAFKWKLPLTLEHDWSASNVHRAATTLRRALLTQPTAAETTMVAEDEKLAKNEKGLTTVSELLDEDEKEEGAGIGTDRFKKPTWEDIVSRKVGFKEEIAQQVEKDLHRFPEGLTKEELEIEEHLAELAALKNHKHTTKKKKVKFLSGFIPLEFLQHRKDLKERKKELEERDPFRSYSNIWHKNCPVKEPIKQAKRFPHHYRCDESFHAYVVALVGSSVFKWFIMLVIICNAVALAAETSESKREHEKVYDVLDNLFLSIYLVEFLLKIYAHPHRYWKSGFNVFDFVILLLSMIQAILTWSELAQFSELKLLVIFRALRILRGISMSVQIQVLITALVATLKTHVLSVLVLLFLLMYIAAIIAFYLFKESAKLKNPWGNILYGMLRLFSFVTLDGWTDTNTEFEKAGFVHIGRIFCLFCVLLGNFLISNIFIAIIIMQISEATEAYRTRERDEREEIISLKKEVVFRRQKLDLRQLLARQQIASTADFYYLASQFIKLLRHDDLVEMNNTQFSPLWMDSFYKSVMRCHHTANVLMNLHRQMADNLLEMYRKNNESRYVITPIRRSRYNRYMKMKAKLAIIRQEFYRDMPSSQKKKSDKLRVVVGQWDEADGPRPKVDVDSKPVGWKKDKSKDKRKGKGKEKAEKKKSLDEISIDSESESDTSIGHLT